MLSNLLVNSDVCSMSQQIPPIHNRKKHSKYLLDSLSDSDHKLKKISSSSSYNVDIADKKLSNTVANSLENSKITEFAGLFGHLDKADKTTCSVNVGRKLWGNALKSVDSSMAAHAPTTDIIEEESALVSALTKQLYMAESQMQRIRSIVANAEDRLRIKDQEIATLKRKVKDWEAKNKNQEIMRKKEREQRKDQANNSEYLNRRCLLLEHKIFEMEKFLSDYGLIWVGDSASSKHQPETDTNNYIETCYDQLRANIEQLNLAAGKGEVYVHHNENGTGASFKTPACMTLKFFKNGMIVADGPLRLYSDAATASFIRDILDGYFPSELQRAHPNGVPFKIEDYRSEMYVGSSMGFPGSGYRLGKLPIADNGSQMSGSWSQRTVRSGPSLKGNFLNAEPPRSLKPKNSSEVPLVNLTSLRSQIMASHNNICSDIHLQSHINAELGLSTRREKRDLATKTTELDVSTRGKNAGQRGQSRFSNGSRASHRSVDRMSSRMSPSRLECVSDRARPRPRSASLSGSRFSGHSVTGTKGLAESGDPPILYQINEPSGRYGELRLKVRSLNGGTVYLVHVSADESVARLYQLLDKAMLRPWQTGYKIVISGYSSRRLEQLEISLKESGITRDSVLHLVND